MASVQQKKRPATWVTVSLLVCTFCLLPVGCFLLSCTAPNKERTAAQVPLGSKLADLDELAVGGWDSLSSVSEYVPTSETEPLSLGTRWTKMGRFRARGLGRFKDWKATDEERNRFTGEVILLYFSAVIPDDLNPSFEIIYIYADGVLKEKQVSHLPG